MLLFLLMMSTAVQRDRVVVVTATAGFRHESIATAEQVISKIAADWFDVTFVRTEEEMADALSEAALRSVKVVIFANTTGDLQLPSRDALLQWIEGGGSFIGIHSASDTWHEWPDYIRMLGGEFDHHPAETTVDVFVDQPDHPAVGGLQSPHTMFEEIYILKNFDRDSVTLLMSLRQSPEDASAGLFPLAWCKRVGQGRVLYTALGHRSDVWTTAWFQQHLREVIAWALRFDERPRRRPTRR